MMSNDREQYRVLSEGPGDWMLIDLDGHEVFGIRGTEPGCLDVDDENEFVTIIRGGE